MSRIVWTGAPAICGGRLRETGVEYDDLPAQFAPAVEEPAPAPEPAPEPVAPATTRRTRVTSEQEG